MVNLMRLLVGEGAHVVFLPADLRVAGEDTAALRQLGVESWHAPFAASVASWMRAHGHRFDVVLLSRHYVAAELLPLVRRFAPQARIVFDTVDLHFLREKRGADIAGDDALRRSAGKTRDRELALMRQAGWTVRDRRLVNAQGQPFEFEILLRAHFAEGGVGVQRAVVLGVDPLAELTATVVTQLDAAVGRGVDGERCRGRLDGRVKRSPACTMGRIFSLPPVLMSCSTSRLSSRSTLAFFPNIVFP